ncbi:uncharacterized protein LOC128738840 [Sabethes cyaneus]|uniref:uncharacterized protein LOC128738840 n=1 Tax=Sabethes cyaneus TaxID=53552 RepID=UPI00237E9673|nr:uncharacterized protein LOC128738840 [Sabethes cyaneus]
MRNMKRKLNALELRRLKENEQFPESGQNAGKQGSTRRRRSSYRESPIKNVGTFGRSGKKLTRREDPREHQDLARDEIALMFMEVSEKIDRCFDFDLQKWLNRYENLTRNSTNFPEAAMLIMSAAQIYGRKVDYLEDIILHMDQDQKGREVNEGDDKNEKQEKNVGGRRRTARFQPQSLSDCFSDLEFTFVDRKVLPIDSLVTTVQKMTVDKRNKFQQMQELCNELRTMPAKQRRQEILNRLRDEANIPSILSSHTAARKHQILDLESGETIGTRYDYQIYLNFIDVKTGSLTPEHDLKKFFQRCDVIDYLYEQQESERERCERTGRPAPEMVFPLKPREFKMYIPPNYLKNKYRIEMNDTSDFDNELHQAKSSNYRTDPILNLMKSKFATRSSEPKKVPQASDDEPSFCNVFSSSAIGTEMNSADVTAENLESANQDECEPSDNAIERTDTMNSTETSFNVSNSTISMSQEQETEVSESNPENETSQCQESEPSTREESVCEPSQTTNSGENCLHLSKESSPEPELMALEQQSAQTADKSPPEKTASSPVCPSRLSYEDEGIGADRETPPDQFSSPSFSRTPSLDVLSDCIGSLPKTPEPQTVPFFGGGVVIPTRNTAGSPRTITIKPVLVKLNMLKIPECYLKKHLLFTLPVEYRKMKNDLVRKSSNRKKDVLTVAVYDMSSGIPKNSKWFGRPVTPEPEDFYGFDDSADVLDDSRDNNLHSLSDELQSNISRSSTPESDFYGFEDCDLEVQKRKKADHVQSKAAVEKDVQKKNTERPKSIVAESVAEVAAENPEPNAQLNPIQQQDAEKPNSQHSTPTRTLSRDSGISDDQNDRRGSRSKETTPEPSSPSSKQDLGNMVSQETATELSTSAIAAEPQPTETNEKYIQSVTEAKELIEKVNNWHRKLKPILFQSEQRNHFDIHAYGTEIIESFAPQTDANSSASNISFAQIMDNKQQDYTARYFLSMLMLANTNNVQIVTRNQNPNRLTTKEDIELRLLSRKRHHQEMESMGERIPCDNSGKVVKKGKISRGIKRKRESEVATNQEGNGDERCLRDDDETEHDFLDKIRRLYPDINSEETMRKRMAFHRGMRRCAYGLPADAEEANSSLQNSTDEQEHVSQEEPMTEELLSVDLLTNEAVMVPMIVDQGPCYSKSISIAESGYGSMLGDGD